MRITPNMMLDQYKNVLNDRLDDINTVMQQNSSNRAFLNASDDPVAAAQSLTTSNELYATKQYQTNSSMANSWLNETESVLTNYDNIMASGQTVANQAASATSASDLKGFADNLKDYQSEMVSTLNKSFNGQYVFGEGETGNPPFKVGDGNGGTPKDGKLYIYDYNNAAGNASAQYIPVTSITTTMKSKMNLKMSIDLGTGNISAGGTFDASTQATDFVCQNVTSSGCTDIYDQMTDAINDLNTGSKSSASGLIDKFKSAQDSGINTKSTIGDKGNMLNFINTRLTDDVTNLTSRLSTLMDQDTTNGILQYNIKETAYKYSLSMSQSVMQESLFDFLK